MDTSGQQGSNFELGQPTLGHYRLADSCEFAEACESRCPVERDTLISYLGSEMVAQLCMLDTLRGEGGNEYIVDIRLNCKGPKRRLLGGNKCGITVLEPEIVKSPLGLSPTDNPYTDPDQTL